MSTLTPTVTHLVPSEGIFIHETLLMHEVNVIIRKLVAARQPLALWCVGVRTSRAFDWTCIEQGNIQMIIDGNPQTHGQDFRGYRVSPPDRIRSSTGTILVFHATNPWSVEKRIRGMGVENEVYAL